MTRIEWVDHPLRKNGFTPFHAEPGHACLHLASTFETTYFILRTITIVAPAPTVAFLLTAMLGLQLVWSWLYRPPEVAQSLCISSSAVLELGIDEKPQSFWEAKLCATLARAQCSSWGSGNTKNTEPPMGGLSGL